VTMHTHNTYKISVSEWLTLFLGLNQRSWASGRKLVDSSYWVLRYKRFSITEIYILGWMVTTTISHKKTALIS
jgi:hypothetical protein